MANRLSPIGFVRASWSGIADHRNGSGGKPDRVTRMLLVILPLAAGFVAYRLNWNVSKQSANLLAAGAVSSAVMMGLFVQIATWRNRLDDRAFTHLEKEAPTRRAVNATAAHTLSGSLASLIATASFVVAGVLDANRLASAIVAALGAYLSLILMLIFHMAWVAFTSLIDPEIELNDQQLLLPESKARIAGDDDAGPSFAGQEQAQPSSRAKTRSGHHRQRSS